MMHRFFFFLNRVRDAKHEQAGDHAGAVDGEATQPLAKVVAPGAEDEDLVAEVGLR